MKYCPCEGVTIFHDKIQAILGIDVWILRLVKISALNLRAAKFKLSKHKHILIFLIA